MTGAMPVRVIRDSGTSFRSRLKASARCRLTSVELRKIEIQLAASAAYGKLPIWDGYLKIKNRPYDTFNSRSSGEVNTPQDYGRFYVGVVGQFQPKVIVEFGAGYGASGMYFLTGVARNCDGQLFSFEPNPAWASIARDNLAAIHSSYTLTTGTFEECVDSVVKSPIDLSFVDGIHTSEFVEAQFELLLVRMSPGGIIIFDDVNFSADMKTCWQKISEDPRIQASALIGSRQGIVQVDRARRT